MKDKMKDKTNKTKKIIIGIVIALVVIALIIVVILIKTNSSFKKRKAANSQVESTETDGDNNEDDNNEEANKEIDSDNTDDKTTDETSADNESEPNNELDESNKYLGDGYEITFTIESSWEGNYNGNFQITNTGDSEIVDWSMKFSTDDDINNIWNAVIDDNDGEIYIIKNDEWNKDIAVSESVSFGFSATCEDDITAPKNFDIITAINNAETNDTELDYEVEYKVNDEWDAGFNAEISSNEDRHYVIKCLEWNKEIPSGKSVNFGFEGKSGSKEDKFENIELRAIEN